MKWAIKITDIYENHPIRIHYCYKGKVIPSAHMSPKFAYKTPELAADALQLFTGIVSEYFTTMGSTYDIIVERYEAKRLLKSGTRKYLEVTPVQEDEEAPL